MPKYVRNLLTHPEGVTVDLEHYGDLGITQTTLLNSEGEFFVSSHSTDTNKALFSQTVGGLEAIGFYIIDSVILDCED